MPKAKSVRQGSEKNPGKITDDSIIKSGLSGVAGDSLPEKKAIFNKLHNEDIWEHNDSYIVLGRDRNSNDLSGYGGKGHASSNAIDIVVGRGSCDNNIKQRIQQAEQGNEIFVDPDFKNDAARIYISQKTDIDKVFNLNDIANGVVGESKAQSGIGIKADSIRVMAREGIKLVSYADITDSNGFSISERKGIDLISIPNKETTEDDPVNNMQPIPKGENLAKALEDIATQLDTLSGILINFVEIQNKYNNIVAMHTHISPFYGIPTPPSIELQSANIEQNLSILSETVQDTLEFKMGYLNKFANDYLSSTSEFYINSRYHHLN